MYFFSSSPQYLILLKSKAERAVEPAEVYREERLSTGLGGEHSTQCSKCLCTTSLKLRQIFKGCGWGGVSTGV